ncbi:NADH-quinone oxidoreductase subunit G 2 [Geodia barretti]|uniref:NADH-ubiquinone oxidoreductase 75 kDa subunit, mitochondrial n=1 Tax=Geodia barretti TaxID=519541 RepID=A0AA35QZE9_GEOBA|nr:NADH-quinone oxidoreductase subunit G 2 [Geodia barretti]
MSPRAAIALPDSVGRVVMSPSATAAAADRATDVSETPVTLNIDGQPVEVAPGTTIHGACVQAGVDTPTLCWAENLTPVNVCRVCVVELEGSRALVPSCSRPAEDQMVVQTDSPRVRHSRRMVLEFLGSGVDLSQADDLHQWIQAYGADPDRYSDENHPVERVDEPVKIQDELYIRGLLENTFAIAVAGRGFDARISTEFDVTLPDSACVYCGNCVGVCPTGALQFKTEYDLREVEEWRPEDQTVTRTVCSYCGVGCNLDLHVQDERIVKVTSPADHSVTSGHLCIKGRFGWQYVHGE